MEQDTGWICRSGQGGVLGGRPGVEQCPAIKQDHKRKARELNNVSFTTPGEEDGIYRLGDMFEAVSFRG